MPAPTLRRLIAPLALAAVAASVAAVPAAAQTPPTIADEDRLDLLAVTGLDDALWVRWTDETRWTSLGGVLTDAAVVVAGADELLFLGVGADRNVWVRTETQSWKPLGPRGTDCSAPSAVVVDVDLVVACRGADGALWVGEAAIDRAGLPAITGWSSRGGVLKHGPAVFHYLPDEGPGIAVHVVVGGDDQLWERTDDDGWARASEKTCGAAPGVAEFGYALGCKDLTSARLRVFYDGPSSGGRVPSSIKGRPGVAVDEDGVTRFYALGADDRVWVTGQSEPGSALEPFRAVGGAGRHGVSAVSMTWLNTYSAMGEGRAAPRGRAPLALLSP